MSQKKERKTQKGKINPLVFLQVLQEKANICTICIPILSYLMSQKNHNVVIIIPILNLFP